MNAFRKWTGLIAALVLMSLPMAGHGQSGSSMNKHFSLSMSVGTINNTQSGNTVMATITNDNPSGSSSQISSFVLTLQNNVSGIAIKNATADPNYPTSAVSVVSSTSVSVNNIPPLKPNQSYTLTMTIDGCGDGNGWSAMVWSGSNFNGALYSDDTDDKNKEITNISCGVVGCTTNNLLGGNTVGTILDAGSMRGPFNQDGACPTTNNAVNYFVTDLLATNNYVHVRWDTTSQPDAVFFYSVSDVPGGSAPKVAWKTDANSNPIFIEAPQCFGGSGAVAPAPFGKLISDGGGRNIKVDTSTAVYTMLPAVPFPIILGPKANEEYLMVTKVSGQTWTVTRGAGASAHAPDTPVMSTPKVRLPSGPLTCFDAGTGSFPCPAGSYVPNAVAQMCYVPNASQTSIYDIGDGYVKGIL